MTHSPFPTLRTRAAPASAAPRLKALAVIGLLALAGCGPIGDVLAPPRGRAPEGPPRPAGDPPVTEARICELARQAVREATGVAELRGATCEAARARPGEWQARVDFISGSDRQSYRVALQPHRQRPDWAVVDITPQAASG